MMMVKEPRSRRWTREILCQQLLLLHTSIFDSNMWRLSYISRTTLIDFGFWCRVRTGRLLVRERHRYFGPENNRSNFEWNRKEKVTHHNSLNILQLCVNWVDIPSAICKTLPCLLYVNVKFDKSIGTCHRAHTTSIVVVKLLSNLFEETIR